MRGPEKYQISLILLGAVSVLFFGYFLHQEVFPEYRIYQNAYVALEKFRSTYTHESPPSFKEEVKQIVIPREDRGPPTIDRCVSCHVALQFTHFSPTKIERDLNGNIVYDTQGNPKQVPNEDYVWTRLDHRIAELNDPKIIEQLTAQGKNEEIKKRKKEVQQLEALKTAQVDDQTYQMDKVLRMHPLIGKETRPFEFHPIEEYGCVSCHNGNGRALTTPKAHGPVFDGQYEVEYMGPKKQFLEFDPKNDPSFSRVFNDKPGSSLLFQTTPIYVGGLIEAKCVQCHQPSKEALKGSIQNAALVTEHRQHQFNAIEKAFENERLAVISLIKLKIDIETKGLEGTISQLKILSRDYTLPQRDQEDAQSQLAFLQQSAPQVSEQINQQLLQALGSPEAIQNLEKEFKNNSAKKTDQEIIQHYLETNSSSSNSGTLFQKAAAWNFEQAIIRHVKDTESSLQQTVSDQKFLQSVTSDIDMLTNTYQRGEQLYLSQACYACHRIAGFARGGVGPELTRSGYSYPWYIKESIYWPQADLKTSTMPVFNLDHEELEALVTFLLGQTGETKATSSTAYKVFVQEWEAGKRSAWEKPVTPAQMHDLRYSMTVFATEGCAACHRLKGFDSNVGYQIEKEETLSYEKLENEKDWFRSLFPETIKGSQIIATIEQNKEDIDHRIVNDVRQNSLLEEIEKSYPGDIEALYSDFKYALRAQNDTKNEELIKEWQERVRRVLMMYVQEYGLGHLIAPRPNWSGVFRTDEWLMEHFHNPSAHVARSIMPVMPFDDTKFYALTYMLDQLGIRNRDQIRTKWNKEGFNPSEAFQIYCSQCHGTYLGGNGPVAQWIYPIPKNLRNADFLRNLTKDRVIYSITHGVKGTPMPPWGEIALDKPTDSPILNKEEINSLADWLFATLPGERVIRSTQDVPKWQYSPKDVIEELHEEGNKLVPNKPSAGNELSYLTNRDQYLAALTPTPTENNEVNTIFNVVSNPPINPDPYSYYIKKEYYTKENIQQGQSFFEINCAACHGKEADGSGPRAEFMSDAKPRMLTNLDWIQTRDDLRLLRSIKYGVPGTAMTPWGDFTSSLQRLQLVIFIRTLSQERQKRDILLSALYQTFETAWLNQEKERMKEFDLLIQKQKAYEKLRDEREEVSRVDAKKAAELYQKELAALDALNKQQSRDNIYLEIKKLIKEKEELFRDIGMTILSLQIDEDYLQLYLKLIQSMSEETDKDQAASLEKDLIEQLQTKINVLDQNKRFTEGKLASHERMEELAQLNSQIAGLENLKKKMITSLEHAKRLSKQEKELKNSLETTIESRK